MYYSLILLGLIIADQLTKIILKNVHLGLLNYQVNYGAAFSILPGYRWLFVIIGAIVLIVLAVYYNKIENKLPLILIAAGTIGNMIDRIALGYVRDFIDLKFWPVFNLADGYGFIGAIFLIYILIKKK